MASTINPHEVSAPTVDEKRVLSILRKEPGKKHKAHLLAYEIGRPDATIRDLVRNLRLKGYLICSDTDGFFIPLTTGDAEHTSKHLWSRAHAIIEVAKAHDAAMAQAGGLKRTTAEQIKFAFEGVE